jgi:hypothetical protein
MRPADQTPARQHVNEVLGHVNFTAPTHDAAAIYVLSAVTHVFLCKER